MEHRIKTKLIMRNDTPYAWDANNPILDRGEVGCAIDESSGVVIYKVGDGVHHWRDLTLLPGGKEQSYSSNTLSKGANTLQEAMEAIAHTASRVGVSMAEAVAALQNIYAIGEIQPITENEKKQNQEYREAIMLQKPKAETKNPYLTDFEIPHYDFEDMNIKDLIDF